MTTSANADCNFVTADYLTEIDKPKSIKSIEIEVPKSAKYSRNLLKIMVVKSEHIPPELKKNFRAIVTINYTFGSCNYSAKVRQKGDFKDHIGFKEGGKPFRSLKVKLGDGNILNAVEFSLLIPETRRNLNEVLGTVLMRNLGFITPETFQVETIVNGVSALMLFQENSQKELLERNIRREGPIFEGDESLFNRFDGRVWHTESLGLSRLTNSNWFLKGESSQYITLSAFSNLQHAYLNYSQHVQARKDVSIYPNGRTSNIFADYFFTLLAMNGVHALRPHNRQYYFNSFSSMLEPIYYDGMLELHQKIPVAMQALTEGLWDSYKFPYAVKISSPKFISNTFKDFKSRVVISDNEAVQFFDKAILNVIKNIQTLQLKVDNTAAIDDGSENFTSSYNSYLTAQKSFNLDQKIIISLEKGNGSFEALDQSGKRLFLTTAEVSTLISDNELRGLRYVYLPTKTFSDKNLPLNATTSENLDGSILHSKGLDIDIDNQNKTITMKQREPTDWILLRNVDLSGWALDFQGLKGGVSPDDNQTQRFNHYGMTGCLNFYQAIFKDTNIHMQDGACEDSVNIVHSQGYINEIQVYRANSDAIDMDFSEIGIGKIEVSGAGNDCVDVSGGRYLLSEVKISNCGDKGISVGEKGNLIANNVTLNIASVGVSSKDLSDTVIKSATFLETAICYEAAQKKQEFGGARLRLGSLSCKGGTLIDKHSSIRWELQ